MAGAWRGSHGSCHQVSLNCGGKINTKKDAKEGIWLSKIVFRKSGFRYMVNRSEVCLSTIIKVNVKC